MQESFWTLFPFYILLSASANTLLLNYLVFNLHLLIESACTIPYIYTLKVTRQHFVWNFFELKINMGKKKKVLDKKSSSSRIWVIFNYIL